MLVVTSSEGSRQAEEGGLSGLVGPGVSWNTRRVPGGQKGLPNTGLGGYGEGLSAGLNEVLANSLATQEGKTGLGSGVENY